MKRIAIVSSFSESCGNAYFTKVLLDSLKAEGYDAQCVELDIRLLQSMEGFLRKKGDQHIKALCKALATYDGVNIQLEAGLYGTFPSDIRARVMQLVAANPNTSVTLHSPRLLTDAAGQRSAVLSLFKGKIKEAIEIVFAERQRFVHVNLNRFLGRQLQRKGVPLIVHTTRAKEQIKRLFSYENVHVHPLKIVPDGFRGQAESLLQLRAQLMLNPEDVVVGVFGYINEYKGHSTALEALTHLPKNYKLLFFGRQHPQTIRTNELLDPYLEKLQKSIVLKRLKRRAFFLGEYETEVFFNLAGAVDVVWLPYVENGQDGSGIASICFDVAKRIVCSSSFSFDETLKLIPYSNALRFDVGNSLELATKTRMIMQTEPASQSAFDKYTIHSQAKLYAALSLGQLPVPLAA
jgi:glycosyltransferase involved in cell wall biosynthesis